MAARPLAARPRPPSRAASRSAAARSPARSSTLAWATTLAFLLALFLGLAEAGAAEAAAPGHTPRAASREDRVAEALAEGDLDVFDPGVRLARGRAPTAWVDVVGFATGRDTAAGRRAADGDAAGGGAGAGVRDAGVGVVVGFSFDRALGPRSAGQRPLARLAFPSVERRAGGPALGPCLDAAERRAGAGLLDDALDGLGARARWSALLPEARVRATRLSDVRLTTDVLVDENRFRDQVGDNLALEARLTFRLDRLVFADEEVQLERMRLDRLEVRQRLALRIAEAAARAHRARATLAVVDEGGELAAEAEARLVEADLVLDTLTGGACRAVGAPGARDAAASSVGFHPPGAARAGGPLAGSP